MNKWIVECNKNKTIFSSFNEAVAFFIKQIADYFKNSFDIFGNDYIPFSISAYFSYKYDEGTITDKEKNIIEELSTLFDLYKNPNGCTNKKDLNIDYKGEIVEFGEIIDIRVKTSNKEIIAELNHNDGEETFLRTNAFVIADDNINYYFYSHQVITTSHDHNELGKSIDLSITLNKYLK